MPAWLIVVLVVVGALATLYTYWGVQSVRRRRQYEVTKKRIVKDLLGV